MFLFDSAHGASSFQRRHPCACKKTTEPRRTKRRAAGLPAGRREPRRVCLLVRHNYTIFYQSCQQKKNARSFRTTFFVEIIQISLFFDNLNSANLRAHGYAAARAETIAGAAGTRKRLRTRTAARHFYLYTELHTQRNARKGTTSPRARGGRTKRPRKGAGVKTLAQRGR